MSDLQSIGYSTPASDDEVAQVRYLHERKNGGPDRRYSNNPPIYIVYRGVIELALLLEGCLQVEKGENKHQVVARISKELRLMAIKQGQTIDEIYRNENGITLQMVRMQMAMAGEIDEKRKTAKIFFDIVSLYKSDRNSFSELLKQAMKFTRLLN